MAGPPVTTVGHGTLGADEFATLLREAHIEGILDVRRFPGSRRHPHFARDEVAQWLPERGIAYRWVEELGGRRSVQAESKNVGLRNAAFQGYADHMATAEFAHGVAALLDEAEARPTAVMCAESVWWRCHRRLLSDHLVLVAEQATEHLFHDGRRQAHPPTPEARRDGDHVTYDVGIDRSML